VSSPQARAVAERTARASYGRLLALVAAPTGDLSLAEDALSCAFERALGTWPHVGVPDNPEGWLLTVARNRLRDVWKSPAHRAWSPLAAATDRGVDAVSPLDDLDPDAIPDRRLELLFVCAHPAIDSAARTPLMLRTVLGIDAARIATAFAVAPATMAQRLVRAKQRIKGARIPFTVPDRRAMPERLPPVLEAVYGSYAITWSDRLEASESLSGEAQYLAVTLATLLETEPEAWALAALITLSLSRAPARCERFVPLDEQGPSTWDAALIAEGESYLRRAARPGPPGRFHLEAAIQAVHCDRARTGATDYSALRTLYASLLVVAPSLGARVALAVVVGRLDGAAAGLAELDNAAREDARLAGFQPFHAARGDLLVRAGSDREAADELQTAARLTNDPAVSEFLRRRAHSLVLPP